MESSRMRVAYVALTVFIATVLVGLFPIVMHAESQAYGATITTKAVKVTKGKFSAQAKQNKVNYLKGTVTIKKVAKAKKAGVKKVKIVDAMYFGKKKIRSQAKTVKIGKLSKNNKVSLKFQGFGKHRITVKYLNKKGKAIKTLKLKKVGAIAEEYNIATLNGTFPVLLFTMQLWDIAKSESGKPVPTVVALSRHDAYDWSKLPANVYSNPLMKTPKAGSFSTKIKRMSALVNDLHKLNKKSKFNFYFSDNYIKGLYDIIYANKIADKRYKVHLLSDGAGTYAWFNSCFNVEGSDPNDTLLSMIKEMSSAKQMYMQGKTYANVAKMSKHFAWNIDSGDLLLSKYGYAAMRLQDNMTWTVGRTSGTFASTDTAFLNNAVSRMTVKSINDMLVNIQNKGTKTEKQFKALYHFSDSMFKDAEKNGKKVFILMGSRVNLEKNFEEFAQYVKQYYGTDEYEFYYKGHPGTPTKLYPEKQTQLDKLGIHDVESSIAAELILYFYPEVYVAGMSNSTLNFSYKEGHTLCYLGTRLANMGSVTAGDLFDSCFTKVTSDYEEAVLNLCDGIDNSFLVEYKDTTKADIAIYNSAKKTITYYKKAADGTYTAA